MTRQRFRAPAPDDLELQLRADADWAVRTTGMLELHEAQVADIRRRAERVHGRLSDPALYIAIVGEFNAGKSTFVNTLLRDRLLPTAPVITTGTATEIRFHEQLSVAFSAHGGPRVAFPNARRAGGERFLRQLRSIDPRASMPSDAREAVRMLIADPEVCPGVETVAIGHPAALLGRNVVLVDTPGINATDDLHADVVERVVAETADLAVVLVPANSPVSRVLIDFLTGSLDRHLDRCVFVVTKLDDIDPGDRTMLLRAIRTRLQKAGVPDPQVYGGGGNAVLDRLLTALPPDDSTADFPRLEAALAELARWDHAIAISTSALHLVSDLLEAASTSATQHRTQLSAARLELDRLKVRDLDGFVAEVMTRARAELRAEQSARRREINEQVSRRAEQIAAALDVKLTACTTTQQVATLVKETAAPLVHKEIEQWCRAVQRDTAKRLSIIADQRIADARRQFSTEYKRLAALAGHATTAMAVPAVQPNSADIAVPVDFSASAAYAATSLSTEKWAVGGFATGGAVLGTMLLPGIGTVLGGLLGAVVGTGAGDQEKKLKARVRSPLLDGGRSAVEHAGQVLYTAVDQACAAEERRCSTALAGLKRVAAGPVAALLAEERDRLAELSTARARAAQAEHEANERLAGLAARRVELAAARGRAS